MHTVTYGPSVAETPCALLRPYSVPYASLAIVAFTITVCGLPDADSTRMGEEGARAV